MSYIGSGTALPGDKVKDAGNMFARGLTIPVPLKDRIREMKGKKGKGKLSVKQKEDIVREVCSGALRANQETKRTGEIREAHDVARLYSEMLSEYYGKRVVDWRRKVEDSGVTSCCARAAAQAKVMQVSLHNYMKAQFWAIDHVFNRAPYYSEIASLWSFRRYEQWNNLHDEGEPPKKVVHISVQGFLDPSKTQFKDEEKYHHWILQEMVKMYGSEEAVWEAVGDSDDEMFPLWFKCSREAWKKVNIAKIKGPKTLVGKRKDR